MKIENETDLRQQKANLRVTGSNVQHVGAAHVEDWDVDSVMRGIEASERRRERITHGLVHLADGEVAVCEEMDLLLGIRRMESTVDRIVSTNARATKRIKLAFPSDRFGYGLTKLGQDIWSACHTVVPLIEQLYPACRRPARTAHVKIASEGMRPAFNPRITVALHAFQVALPTLRWHGRVTLDVNEAAVRRVLDHLLRSIRRICRSRRFKYLENNYRQNARLRLRDASKYMADLFAHNSRLLILRVDLYFRPVNGEWVDTAVAGRSIKRYMRALREERIVPDVRGWLARLENGFRRGIHVHLLIAMDGHKHREAASWSRVLGDTWVNKFSGGYGAYFNCYTRKGWYRFNGLGLVHISDHAKLLGVREALRYITKPDFQIATGFVRNFRKGLPNRSGGFGKRGAPRKVEYNMSLVGQILGNR
jgi:hypothetical protein